MTNHYHLLVRTPKGNISRAMRYLNGFFTQKLNNRYDADGPIFKGRFKSTLVEQDNYFLALSRYIHLNPVEAGIVKRPEKYKWSSYRAYVGLTEAPDWLSRDTVMSFFDDSMVGYSGFVMSKLEDELTCPPTCG